MCFFSRPAPSPPLPEPRQTPPKPEPTAERVVVGSNRTRPAPNRPAPASVTGQQTTGETGRKRTGQRQQRAKRLGTRSLRIPLIRQPNNTEDLNI